MILSNNIVFFLSRIAISVGNGKLFFTARQVSREEMGLPEDWARIEDWIKFEGPVPEAAIDNEIRTKKKNPEVPVLNDYSKKPPIEFWKIFPSNPLPENILTNVLAENLIELLNENRSLLTDSQFVRGMKAANSLLNGADSCQKGPLPSCHEKNAKKTVLYGEAVTDTVATWVKKGFASCPFDTPPLDNFRSNCLIAIPQNNKVCG